MPIFFSYSHENADFVNRLGTQLVRYGVRVWIDSWELNVGDSIIDKIQHAIQASDALIIILSKASVESEWCKKELSSGLLRELEEKRVVVLPVLIEDCKIPLFLRGKKYADFRKNYDEGFRVILEAIAKINSQALGRIDRPEFHTDWAIDDGLFDGQFAFIRNTLVEAAKDFPYTVLTEIDVIADSKGTERFKGLERKGLISEARYEIINLLAHYVDEGNKIQLVLDSEYPQKYSFDIVNHVTGAQYHGLISSRRLGEDTGKNVFVDVGGQIQHIRTSLDKIRRTS